MRCTEAWAVRLAAVALSLGPACGGSPDTAPSSAGGQEAGASTGVDAAAASGSGAGSTGSTATSSSGSASTSAGSASGSGAAASSGAGGSSGSASSLVDSGIPAVDDGAPTDATSLDGQLGSDSSLASPDTGPVGDGGPGWDQIPAILSRIVPPTFPNLDCDITNYGGIGDGTTDNTNAFAKAVADCSSKGGGRVVVPAGTFFTGPIELKSNIDLYVAAGATIKFSTDPAKYLPVVEVSWEGSLAQNYHPLVWAHDATNVAITGPGTIDGNATKNDWYKWGSMQSADQASLRNQDANGVAPAQRIYGAGHYLRPGLIEFLRCTNVLFDGFTAKNSPFWTIHPVLSTNITARNFHSLADTSVPNTDGFDPEACSDVHVQNATIQVGDDSIAIKAGRDRDGMTYYKPSENIVIEGSNLLSRVGGITIGSEMSSGVRNVYVQDTTLGGAGGDLIYGFFIKAATTRGGFIQDVYARRLTIGTVNTFFFLTGHYVSGAVIGPTAFTTFKNINVDSTTVGQSTGAPFLIAGSDATKVATGIHFSNVTIKASGSPALASGSGHYKDLTTSNVVVNGQPFNPPASAP